MLRLLADENLSHDIVRGVRRRGGDCDIISIPEIGLTGADDSAVLAWAAANDRIVLTHDRATMPDFAFARITNGQTMPGVFLLNDRIPVGQAIEEVLLLDECSEQAEWEGRVVHIPL